MDDGLYRVVRTNFVAGFVVKNGKVTHCAPILRRQLGYWITQGERVEASDAGSSVTAVAEREAEPA